MTDPISGMSRGYGFVRFADEQDQQRALSEMQGVCPAGLVLRWEGVAAKPAASPGVEERPDRRRYWLLCHQDLLDDMDPCP